MDDRSFKPDALAAILQDLRPARASYGRLALRAPWGISLPFQRGVRFHLVVSGQCQLSAPGEEPVTLAVGDVGLLPHGGAHILRDKPLSPTVPLASLEQQRIGQEVYRLDAVSGGAETLLVCCTVDFAASAAQYILKEMPGLMVVRAGGDANISTFVALMSEEARRERMGMATLLPRMADIVVTWSIRAWAEHNPGQGSRWLEAVRDPGIGTVLRAIHEAPGKRWTIAEFAKRAGMSRSSFIDAFGKRVGLPPARYLRDWRMALAFESLQSDRSTIADVAAALGYGSEAAFSRAFKRSHGTAPGAIRRSLERAA